MAENGKLSDSLEDYLEAIYKIVNEKQAVRAKDIAEYLNVNSASVTGALRSLSKKGYINYTPYDVITLNVKGKKLSKDIVRRHEALSDFFTKILHIDEQEAEETACGMEHSISQNVLNRLLRFTDFLQHCPRSGNTWIKKIWESCEQKENAPFVYCNCETCISGTLAALQKKKDVADNDKESIPLQGVAAGAMARIVSINDQSSIKNRFDHMGIKKGETISVLTLSSHDDSMDIKCRGYYINLRADEATHIMVQVY